ncbi:MAG: 4Fe-4S dicluster domain-containing protein [Actinobacteria bacterium]|nr:4Fe-4S dicluster domain-containing protein [Actinomycetota bacterium]
MAEKRYAMVLDLRRCIGCHACHVACKSENEVPFGVFRTHVRYYERGEYPDTKLYFLPVLCNHCKHPACVRVCPTGASWKRDDGIVLVDYDKCIGCKYCMAACPYGVRFIHPEKQVADKCTFCVHRVDAGIAPSCVNTCIGRARIFGDMNDPNSEVAKLIATNPVTVLKPEKGTYPTVFYISNSVKEVE